MTLFAVICFLASLGLVGGVAHPRTRRLLIKREPQRLLPGETQALREWKAVFRDTVISVEGGLSSEMEAFLAGEELKATGVVSEALVKADRILVDAVSLADEAKSEADKIVNNAKTTAKKIVEAAHASTNTRRVLADGNWDLFFADMKTCTTGGEREDAAQRWHYKGYMFPANLRKWLLDLAKSPDEREAYRDLFDEQDQS